MPHTLSQTLALAIVFSLQIIRFILAVTTLSIEILVQLIITCMSLEFNPLPHVQSYNLNILPDPTIYTSAKFLISQPFLTDVIDDLIRIYISDCPYDETPQLSLDLIDHVYQYELTYSNSNTSHETPSQYINSICSHLLLSIPYTSHPVAIKSTSLYILFDTTSICYIVTSPFVSLQHPYAIPFEALLAFTITMHSFIYALNPLTHAQPDKYLCLETLIFTSFNALHHDFNPESINPICYTTLPYSHLSPLSTHVEMFPHFSYLTTFVLAIFRESAPSLSHLLSSDFHSRNSPSLHILEQSPAIRFNTDSFHRMQFLCVATFPLLHYVDLTSKLHFLNHSLTKPAPGSYSQEPVHSTLTDMYLGLPPELHRHIYERCILSAFSKCQCHVLECHKRKHTNQCRKGKVSKYSRSPKMFPISYYSHTSHNDSNEILFTCQFMYTIPLRNDNLHHQLLQSFTDLNEFIDSTIVLAPCHGQFSIQPFVPFRLQPILKASPHQYLYPNAPPSLSDNKPTHCPSHDNQFIPMSHLHPAHTLCFD